MSKRHGTITWPASRPTHDNDGRGRERRVGGAGKEGVSRHGGGEYRVGGGLGVLLFRLLDEDDWTWIIATA